MNTTFDLNAYGVQEMSHQEMVEVSGGWRENFRGGPFGVIVSLIFSGREEQVSVDTHFCSVVNFPGVGLPPK